MLGGVSVYQILILLALCGIPLMYFIITRGATDDIQRPLRFFHWSFWIAVVADVLFIFLSISAANPDSVGASLGLALVSSWSYLIALGVVASRTGRSWILWVGLTFITSVFGMVVSYAMMSGRAESGPKELT